MDENQTDPKLWPRLVPFETKEEPACPSMNTDVAPDTSTNASKDSTPPEDTCATSEGANDKPAEQSRQEEPSASLVPVGRLPTEVKPLGVPTVDDEPEERQGKFKALVDRLYWGKPNPLLAKGKYRELGTFTIWQNGHIDINKAVMKDKAARAFKVIAVQLDRRGTIFRATAQPILKRKPKWWNDVIFGALIHDLLEEMQAIFQHLNERKFDAGVSTVGTPGTMELKRN